MARSRWRGDVLLRGVSQQVEDTFWGALEVYARNLALRDKGLEIRAIVKSFHSAHLASFL